MSQIVIEIPIEALAWPNVAKAFGELTLAIGGHSAESLLSHVAVPVVFADARLVPAVPAANMDVEVDHREDQFFEWVAKQGDLHLRYFRGLKTAGSTGLSTAEARQLLPELDSKHPKMLAAIAGYAGRWCKHCLGIDSPVEKTQDGQRWIGWPKTA